MNSGSMSLMSFTSSLMMPSTLIFSKISYAGHSEAQTVLPARYKEDTTKCDFHSQNSRFALEAVLLLAARNTFEQLTSFEFPHQLLEFPFSFLWFISVRRVAKSTEIGYGVIGGSWSKCMYPGNSNGEFDEPLCREPRKSCSSCSRVSRLDMSKDGSGPSADGGSERFGKRACHALLWSMSCPDVSGNGFWLSSFNIALSWWGATVSYNF